ncbi:hypothetical protein [Streptomyces sp. NPDC101393]|uniref:deoxynucleotide monophosphate kinase family protein n=1 Tax=Streptomyces sp. NPDC101393 TaxID=3366141 RepID=UPI0038155195
MEADMHKHVALVGKARSGKDTVGQILVQHAGYTRLAFADKLKEAALRLDPEINLRRQGAVVRSDWLSALVGARSWETAKAVYPEVRRFLQEFGQTMRELDPHIWIRPVMTRVMNGTRWNMPTVVTDVRYLNEVDALRDQGALIVRVERPGAGLSGDAGAHASETELDAVEADVTIVNDGTLDDLADDVRTLYRYHLTGE